MQALIKAQVWGDQKRIRAENLAYRSERESAGKMDEVKGERGWIMGQDAKVAADREGDEGGDEVLGKGEEKEEVPRNSGEAVFFMSMTESAPTTDIGHKQTDQSSHQP